MIREGRGQYADASSLVRAGEGIRGLPDGNNQGSEDKKQMGKIYFNRWTKTLLNENAD